MKNRPRIKPFTNTRMDGDAFVHSWSIRGWSLGAKVNALREPHKGVILQSQSQEELDALLPSVLDRAFKGEL